MRTRILFLGLLLALFFKNDFYGQIVPNGQFTNIDDWSIDNGIVLTPIADATITSFDGMVLNGNSGNFILKSPNFILFSNESYILKLGVAYFGIDNFFSIIPFSTNLSIVLKDSNGNLVENFIINLDSYTNTTEGINIENFLSKKININNTASYFLEISGQLQGSTFGGTDYLNTPFKETFIFDNIDLSKVLDHNIQGIVNFDSGANNCSSFSNPINNIELKSTGTKGTYFTSTDPSGNYAFAFDEDGSVTTEIITQGLSLSPNNYSNTFVNGTNKTITNQDFCVSSSVTGDDVSVLVFPTSDARPGFTSKYRIQYINTGSTTISGGVVLNFEDTKATFFSSSPSINNSTINSLTWGYSALQPFEIRNIDVEFTNNTPTQLTNALNGGDVLNFTANITPLTADVNQNNNSFTLVQPVVNSYDPNDATILEGSQITAAQATQDLHFRIRFQNTGSASAINVNIKTDLDLDLDWATFTPISASHAYNTSVNSLTGEVNFNFPNINLPDDASDPLGSNGWVLFKVKPKTTFVIGDKIDCGADIFFDYNFPIITNVAQTEIFVPTANLYTAIPDAAFEFALLDLGIDTEGIHDGRVLTSDISGIISLDVSDPLNNTSLPSVTNKITDLTGIEDFVSLQVLNLNNNNISSIDISNLSALYYLILSSNPLNMLDTSLNNNLLILQLNNTGLTSLNLTSNSRLESLNIDNTPLTYIDTRQNPNLKTFSAEIVPLTNVDLSQNPLLEYLELRDNNLSTLDISHNLKLQVFVLTGSPFISLDLIQHKELNELRINNNSLLTQLKVNNSFNTNISTFNFNVTNNASLTCIQVDNVAYSNTNWTNIDSQHIFSATACPNSLTYVPDDNLEAYLETHDAQRNVVALGSPNSMGNGIANDDYVFTNRINTVTNLQIPNLSIVDMIGIEDFAALEVLIMNDNFVVALDLSSNTSLQSLVCNNNQIASLDLSSNSLLKDLVCDHNKLLNLNVSSNPALLSLSCSNNLLPTLDVSSNPLLWNLSCQANQLSVLNVGSNPLLKELACDNNLLTALDVSFNAALEFLGIQSNSITSLNASSNGLLNQLWCSNNQLTSLNIANGNNSGITVFNSTGNSILTCITADASTPVTGLTGWVKDSQHIFSTGCPLTYVPDDNLEAYLETHDAQGNLVVLGAINSMGNGIVNDDYVLTSRINTVTSLQVPNLSISEMTGIEDFLALERLSLNDNTVSNLDVSSNLALIELNCSNNLLTSLDVSSNTVLKTLFCSTNQISTLDVTSNTALEFLFCSFNQISVLDFSSNALLNNLAVGNNQLSLLDVSSNPLLTSLSCDNNNLSALDVSVNTGLTFLGIQNNQITTLDVSTNNALSQLWVSFNKLTSLNITNGNNTGMPLFNSTGNPDLTCITADASTPSTGLTGWVKDSQHLFSANCGIILYPDTYTVAEDTVLSVSGTNDIFANDLIVGLLLGITQFEVEGVVYSPAGIAPTSAGTIQIENLGSFIFTPNDNFCGPVPQITYSVLDENGINTLTSTIDITVTCVNDAPICVSDTNSIAEDTTLTVSATSGILANDSDVDGDSLTVSNFVIGGTNGVVGSTVTILEGDITIYADGSYTFVPTANFNGSVPQITYTISDGTDSSSCTLDITVTPVNDAPVAVDDTITDTSGNPITANDTDIDGTIDASSIILIDSNNALNTGNSSTPLVISGIGIFTIDITGNISFTTDSSFTGTTATVNYTVNDNDGLTSNSATITIAVSNGCSVTLIPDTNFEQALINQRIDSDGIINGQVCTSDINTIKDLAIEYNNIKNLTGIEGFVALEELSMEGNPLTSNPDFSQNLLLEKIEMSSCQLTSLDVTKNLKLTDLSLFDNSLYMIDVSKNVLLETLFVGKNNLTTIDVSFNTELDGLYIGKNNFSTINLTNNLKLRDLNIEGNNFTILDVSFLPVLNALDANNNELTQLNIANGNNSSFQFLDTRNNIDLTCIQTDTNAAPSGSVSKDPAHVFNTDCSTTWTVMTNPTTTTALLAIPGLDDGDGKITIAEAAAYTGRLDLSGSGITDVEGLQAFTGITTLDVSGNGITDLSPLTNSSFTIVAKSIGKLKKVAKTTTMALETLIVSNNSFNVIDLSSLTNLKVVKLNNNPNLITVSIKNGNNASITDFDSSNTPNLTCILVDNPDAIYLNNWVKDIKSEFVANEAQCRAEVLSIDNFDLSNTISLYPNPVSDYLKVELSNQLEIKSIQIYNVIGKLVNETKNVEIDFSKITKGIYLIKIITNKGTLTKKVIKS